MGCVVEYNTERPHQRIGDVPPIRRFELAVAEPFEVVVNPDPAPPPESVEVVAEPRRVTRKVGKGGRISLASHSDHVGRWLAGETVDVSITVDGLVEVSHRGVLVATHARQHPPEAEPQVWRRQPRLDLSGLPRWASQLPGRSTRQGGSASLGSTTGSATHTVDSRSKSDSSATPSRSHRTGNCCESTP